MNKIEIKLPEDKTPTPRISDIVVNPFFKEGEDEINKYGKIFKKSKENVYVYFNNGSNASYFPIKKLKKLGTTKNSSRNVFYFVK